MIIANPMTVEFASITLSMRKGSIGLYKAPEPQKCSQTSLYINTNTHCYFGHAFFSPKGVKPHYQVTVKVELSISDRSGDLVTFISN